MVAPLAFLLVPGSALQDVSPDSAVLLATGGAGLIFLELNRPGSILPGALGLLLVLSGAAVILRYPVEPWAVALLAVAIGGLLLNVWLRLPVFLLGAATLALVAGARFLVPSSGAMHVHTRVALPCGAALGGAAAVLSRVALRARRAKRVN